MAVTRKIKTNDLDNAINGLMQKPETPAKTKATPAVTKEKKTSICFQMNESTKHALETYCENNEMTLTAGIKKAIREMLQRENVIM